MIAADLLAAVDAESGRTEATTPSWPAPHPDRDPRGEEYSRCLDPGKYRIVGTRADAWVQVLTARGLATSVDCDPATVVWQAGPHTGASITRARWLRPSRPGALPMVLCTTGFEGCLDNGLVVGVGEPAVQIIRLPVCGCDACDDGSAALLRELDRDLLDVLSGAFTHVITRDGTVTGGRDGWSAQGSLRSETIESILADARQNRSQHTVLRGEPWF